MSSEEGFSLIEVLMAVMLLAVCVLGLLVVLSQTTRLLLQTNLKQSARNLATAQLEYIKSSEVSYDNITLDADLTYTPKSDLDNDYGFTTEVASVIRMHAVGNPSPPLDEGVQKITLIVLQGDSILTTLEGYKAQPYEE